MQGVVYRVAVNRLGALGSDRSVHLVREGSEASLCGLPKSALGPVRIPNDVVCESCMEWLPRRMAETGKWPVTPAQGSTQVREKASKQRS